MNFLFTTLMFALAGANFGLGSALLGLLLNAIHIKLGPNEGRQHGLPSKIISLCQVIGGPASFMWFLSSNMEYDPIWHGDYLIAATVGSGVGMLLSAAISATLIVQVLIPNPGNAYQNADDELPAEERPHPYIERNEVERPAGERLGPYVEPDRDEIPAGSPIRFR